MIKALLFDLGNVLVDFDHTIAAKRISQFCDKNPEQIFELFFSSEITMLFEEGKISPRDFYIKVKEMLNLRLGYESFVPIWNEIFFLSAKNRAVYSLIEKTRGNYKIAMVTNINILHYEYLKKYFPVFNIFHDVFTSCELGAAKPKAQIYQAILDSLDVRPEEAFYTDDRLELVESANSLGIKGFVFTGVDDLKKDLFASGVTL